MRYFSDEMTYHFLDSQHTDPARIRKEREKARKLRKSAWWQKKLQEGRCYYCGSKRSPRELTADHRIPLARGGVSSRENLVPACMDCNQKKGLETPVELLLGS